MIPIGDENPKSIFPFVNWALIVLNTVVFIWQFSGTAEHFNMSIVTYGLVPAYVMTGRNVYSLVTNIFLHGGPSHLLGNMLFLWVFGDNIEDRLGHVWYTLFYLFSGVGASLVWMLTSLGSLTPAVGASGAISGVLGAYFVFFPHTRIRAVVTYGFFIRVRRVPASIMIGLWFVYQLVLGFTGFNTGVAYAAHIAGFIIGYAVSRNMKIREPFMYSREWV